MTALRERTARLLLDRVSEADRTRLVRDVTKSLEFNAGRADVSFAATLLQLNHDEEARNDLLEHLQTTVEHGDPEQAAVICLEHPGLGTSLAARIADSISQNVRVIKAQHDRGVPAGNPGQPKLVNGDPLGSEQALAKASRNVLHGLEFAMRTTSFKSDEAEVNILYQSCIDLLALSDKKLSRKARDVVFTILRLAPSLSVAQKQTLWSCIHSLLLSTEAEHQTLGFTIWLKWSTSGHAPDPSTLQQPEYWSLIVEGLRFGDTERRKMALQVMRLSVSLCTSVPSLAQTICSAQATESDMLSIIQQYSRFCTVFETIILGRYLNQVQECEADLDFLASEHSAVQPVWLFTLLGCAFEKKMQDSNRRFIGSWTMRSRLRTDDPGSYVHFLRTAFLPWVTGGSHFTSSLKMKNGAMQCEHGDYLADYICRQILSNPKLAPAVIDAILNSIQGRYGNNFAYAMVYLIEGISRAVDNDASVDTSSSQLESMTRIATWAGLPEVARDYILARSWKLCYDQLQRPGDKGYSDATSLAAENWSSLQDFGTQIKAGSSAHMNGNVASLALAPSKRDKRESAAVEKCKVLSRTLSGSLEAADHIEEMLVDIWNDLEYLEYPKSLLMVLSSMMPSTDLLQSAISQGGDGTLATMIGDKTQELLELSASRSSLLPPLARSIRHVALTSSEASCLIRADDLIVYMASHPPKQTIDDRLEAAVVELLQSLDPATKKLNREYYFGPCESYGYAALLDLSSRIGAVDVALSQQIFERILNRWVQQKTPPPSVSSWKTSLQLQVMLLCAEQWLPTAEAAKALQTLTDLHYILSIEPLPRLRYLIEWMIARIYIHHPDARHLIFDQLRSKDHHSNPKFLASLMKIGVMIARTDHADELFASELATVFVPLAASSKVLIRHEAQWQIPVLMDHATRKGWRAVSENSAFKALDEFIRSLERFSEPPLERQIDKLDPVQDHNMTHLIEGSWWDLDHIERRQTNREDFLRLCDEDKASSVDLPKSCMPLGNPASRPVQHSRNTTATTSNHDRKILQNIDNICRALGSEPAAAPTALQTKGAAYLESGRSRHDNLLVIASLIDNPFNLGGLSRVSEIFGAGALYLNDTKVTSHKDFTGVSVSSHLHFPIEALPSADIVAFLIKKKREGGFTVIGIEQTDRSVVLGEESCRLPEKCILVLGSEKEGIPAMVLAECDLLVEIRQVGVTRSLNVQTAAGIVLNEYVRQRRSGGKAE